MDRKQKDDRYYENLEIKVKRVRQSFGATSAGAAAVVVVFVINPFSERARIEELKGFEDSLYYHVWVNESINFTEGSVALVFETEDEIFRIPLQKGTTYGILEGVRPITGYPAIIEGSEGFGVSTIVSSGVFSKDDPDFEIYDPKIENENDDLLVYNFKTYYQDLFDEIEDLRFIYGYTTLKSEEFIELFESEISLDQSIVIKDIPNQNVLVQSKIVGVMPVVDAEGNRSVQTVVVDEDQFFTPLFHESSFEIIRVVDSVIEYEVIPDYRYLKDVSYKVTIYENDRELESKTVNELNTITEHKIRFERLFPSTQYKIVHEMIFNDHRTNSINTILIAENDITTLEKFDFVSSFAERENNYLVSILVDDVNSLFESSYYEIRDGERIVSTQEINLININSNTKFVEFTINKNDLRNRTLVYGVIMNDDAATRYEIRKIRR
jgi:hypothetical protein